MSDKLRVLLHSSKPGYLYFGREWDQPTICEVRKFDGPRPSPEPGSDVGFILSPDEYRDARAYNGKHPVKLMDPTAEHVETVKNLRVADALKNEADQAQARLAAIRLEVNAAEARRDQANADAAEAQELAKSYEKDAEAAMAVMAKAEKATR